MFARKSLLLLLAIAASAPCAARTIYRCERDGVVSLATSLEPGSRCESRTIDDDRALPNLWGVDGRRTGTMYRFEYAGETGYTTRALPGATKIAGFAVVPPKLGFDVLRYRAKPHPEMHDALFVAAARRNAIDDAWLRAIAQVESDFRARARSPVGAKGIMQLMPDTAKRFRVRNPYSPSESIAGGARYLSLLLRRFDGDRNLAAAAYNAGAGNVDKYGGVPPFSETRAYVQKVQVLYNRYQNALAVDRDEPRPRRHSLAALTRS